MLSCCRRGGNSLPPFFLFCGCGQPLLSQGQNTACLWGVFAQHRQRADLNSNCLVKMGEICCTGARHLLGLKLPFIISLAAGWSRWYPWFIAEARPFLLLLSKTSWNCFATSAELQSVETLRSPAVHGYPWCNSRQLLSLVELSQAPWHSLSRNMFVVIWHHSWVFESTEVEVTCFCCGHSKTCLVAAAWERRVRGCLGSTILCVLPCCSLSRRIS